MRCMAIAGITLVEKTSVCLRGFARCQSDHLDRQADALQATQYEVSKSRVVDDATINSCARSFRVWKQVGELIG